MRGVLGRPPPADPANPVEMARWMQRVEDRLDHLHECVERKAEDAAKTAALTEEVSESRHQQNTAALQQMQSSLLVATAFIENANKSDVAKQAVMGERQRVREARAKWVTHGTSTVKYLTSGAAVAAIGGVAKLLGWV